ncbi:MAG: hypothetical protein LBK13_00670 [Spirochaetales bacterium]|jgi:vacuolar-type H+-ATPase subunit H|nr:hypothetical protein [Spirochaetales bacterium]
MSDENILKKILEAENSGRELVREAQEKADKRVREVLAALQEDFHVAREERFRQLLEESRTRCGELQRLQDEKLAGFERNLREHAVSSGDAAREVRKILTYPGETGEDVKSRS